MARICLTNGQKLAIIADTNRRLLLNESLKSIARFHNVQPVQLRNWKRSINKLNSTKKTKKSVSKGMPGRLNDFEDSIMGWAFQQREAGIPLMYRHLIVKATELNDAFRQLDFWKQYHTIRRLCVRNGFVIRRVTPSDETSKPFDFRGTGGAKNRAGSLHSSSS